MSNIVPLDNNAHADLRVLLHHSEELGDSINQIPILASEFEEAQRHYPILFMKDEAGKLHAMAILGFDKDENLFLEGDKWDGYVPAIVRRGPFLIGTGNAEDPVIHLDLDHPRVREGGDEGAPLFLEQGGRAPALEAALDALRAIHVGAKLADPMQSLFEELGLVEEVKMTVHLSETHGINFEGYLAVTHEKLDALDGAALEKLNKAGLLQSAIFAASSLYTMQKLVARKQAKGLPE